MKNVISPLIKLEDWLKSDMNTLMSAMCWGGEEKTQAVYV